MDQMPPNIVDESKLECDFVLTDGASEEPVSVDWMLEESNFPKTYDLLGGRRLLKHKPSTRADIHAVIVGGMRHQNGNEARGC